MKKTTTAVVATIAALALGSSALATMQLQKEYKAKDPKANCASCHGFHNIFPSSDVRSSVNADNLNQTCGRCHVKIYGEYKRSTHGRAVLAKGNKDAPSCINCHGEHDILPPREDASAVAATHIPETCSQCHSCSAIKAVPVVFFMSGHSRSFLICSSAIWFMATQ